MSDSPWQPGDKAWKAERTKLWRVIQGNLALLVAKTRLRRSDFKHHREMFFEGTIHGRPYEEIDAMGEEYAKWARDEPPGAPFASMLPLYWVWYHPEVESLELDVLRRYFFRWHKLVNCQGLFFHEWRNAGCSPPNLWPADYGMMGGRESKIIELLYPGVDYRQPAPGSDPEGHRRTGPVLEHPSCMKPRAALIDCVSGSEIELCMDARFYPHCAEQFTWPHLSFAIQHYPDQALGSEENGEAERHRQRLKRLMAEILAFENRTDKSRRRPSTIALVERVCAMQRSGEFSEALDTLWQEASASLDELTAESAELGIFMKPEAAISRRGSFRLPVKEQRARIAQWILGLTRRRTTVPQEDKHEPVL